MSETIRQIHAARLAQAFNLAAARNWALAERGHADDAGIEQGTALIAYFVRRERRALPAAIVMIGSKDLLDWALLNVRRSALGIARETFVNTDGDTVLVLTAAVP
jgi:hypothetical protein